MLNSEQMKELKDLVDDFLAELDELEVSEESSDYSATQLLSSLENLLGSAGADRRGSDWLKRTVEDIRRIYDSSDWRLAYDMLDAPMHTVTRIINDSILVWLQLHKTKQIIASQIESNKLHR